MKEKEDLDPRVKPFTEEFLRDIRARGEIQIKKFADMPTVMESDGTWVITYCIENFIRCATVSRYDMGSPNLEDFFMAVPDFKKVFGEPAQILRKDLLLRGPGFLITFNNFFKDPAFATGEESSHAGT